MSTALPIFDVFSRQQPGNTFCLNDQTHIACSMCFKRCVASNLYIISPKIYLLPVYNIQKIEKLDDTHLLKHMKQAILVWSFRQNIFLGSLLQKSSISTHGRAAVMRVFVM